MNEPEGVLMEGPLVMDLETLPKVFTAERTRLLAVLRERGAADSLAMLAKRLDRHASHVSRDVSYLEGIGLVVRTRVGREVRIEARRRPIHIH